MLLEKIKAWGKGGRIVRLKKKGVKFGDAGGLVHSKPSFSALP